MTVRTDPRCRLYEAAGELGLVRCSSVSYRLPEDLVGRLAGADLRHLYTLCCESLRHVAGRTFMWSAFRQFCLGAPAQAMKAIRMTKAIMGHLDRCEDPEGRLAQVPRPLLVRLGRVSAGVLADTKYRHYLGWCGGDRQPVDHDAFCAAVRGEYVRPSAVGPVSEWIRDGVRDVRLVWPMVERHKWRAVADCVGMSSYPHRGSWFGELHATLLRDVFWCQSRITASVRMAGWDPDLSRRLMHHKLPPATNMRQCPLRLALLGFLLLSTGTTLEGVLSREGADPNGRLWRLNRLLPLDAGRWPGGQLSWAGTPLCPSLATALEDDLALARKWLVTDTPVVYNCEPEDVPGILIEAAGFWQSFFGAIEGGDWGQSPAGDYVTRF